MLPCLAWTVPLREPCDDIPEWQSNTVRDNLGFFSLFFLSLSFILFFFA